MASSYASNAMAILACVEAQMVYVLLRECEVDFNAKPNIRIL